MVHRTDVSDRLADRAARGGESTRHGLDRPTEQRRRTATGRRGGDAGASEAGGATLERGATRQGEAVPAADCRRHGAELAARTGRTVTGGGVTQPGGGREEEEREECHREVKKGRRGGGEQGDGAR